MSVSYFQRGAQVEIESRQYVMKRQLPDAIWQLEALKTGRIIEHTNDELRSMYARKLLVFIREVNASKLSHKQTLALSERIIQVPTNITDEDWEKAKIKRQYVLAVKDLPGSEKIINLAIKQTNIALGIEGKGPNWITVLRWKKKFIQHGKDIYSFFAKHAAKGNRVRRYPKIVLDIVEDIVELHYLTLEKKTVATVLEHAILAVGKENDQRLETEMLPLPSRRLIEAAISNVSAFDRCAAREGQMIAIKKFRSVLYKNITNYALERAEIDHTLLDIFVIDDKTFMPLGRPWVTACIDTHTRCLLGIYIGFEPPSNLTVSRCLKHAFMPKSTLQDDWPSISNAWEAHGVMENLVVDNGLEFHSKALEQIALAFGINITYSARKTPWYKGKIERFFGTLNRNVAHPTPGTTFSNIFEKQEYDPSKHAIATLSTMKEVVHKWVADVYHQRPHKGLNEHTPADVWRSSVPEESIPLPDDPDQLDALMGATEMRSLSLKGLVLDGIWYNSPDLAIMRRQLGEELDVNVRINEGDLGHVYVALPEHQSFIKVSAIDKSYAESLTKFQHKIIQRYAAKKNYKKGIPGWLRAKGEIYEIFEQSLEQKSVKSRSKVARFSESNAKPEKAYQEVCISYDVDNKIDSPVKTVEKIKPHKVTSTRPSFKPIIENRNLSNE